MNNDLQNSQTSTKPTHEQIASRAEVLWKAQGSPSGRDEEIWLEAERQLYDEAREIIGGTAASAPTPPPAALSSEEPAMPPEARQQTSASEHMTSAPKPSGAGRRRSSGR